MAEIVGRQNGIAEEFDQINACIAEVTAALDTAYDGGEMAVIKRGQDGLMEEGLSLRDNITTKCQRFTRSMTMARQ